MNSNSQRINPDGLFEHLISTFGMSAIGQFRKFLARHPMVTKWMIASDFVINEAQAASDAYAYTFFPYDAEIQDLKAKIVKLVPKDFKRTKTVKPKLHELLGSKPTPHSVTNGVLKLQSGHKVPARTRIFLGQCLRLFLTGNSIVTWV